MDEDRIKFLRKLRQIEEHARALTHEIAQGPLQNRARLIWGLVSHLVVRYELEQPKATSPAPEGGAYPLPPRPR